MISDGLASFRLAASILWLLYNGLVFAVYVLDKRRAVTGGWRVSERSLIILALFGGGVGAFLASRLLRHKTRVRKFHVLLPIALAFSISAIFILLIF